MGVRCLCHAAWVSPDQAVFPSGVVTFLFTDVEGSTRRWETDADEMRAALAAHDEVLRRAIETHGGFMFKHTGRWCVCGIRVAEVGGGRCYSRAAGLGVAGADGHWRPVRQSCGTATTSVRCSTGPRG